MAYMMSQAQDVEAYVLQTYWYGRFPIPSQACLLQVPEPLLRRRP